MPGRYHTKIPRAIGLNILFTSKQILKEARPILMAHAMFTVDMAAMFTRRRGRSSDSEWPQNYQGFSEADLSLVQNLKVPTLSPPDCPFLRRNSAIETVTSRNLMMPRLTTLVMPVDTRYWQQDMTLQEIQHRGIGLSVLNHMQDFASQRIKKLGRHLRRMAQKHNGEPVFIITWKYQDTVRC
jgi:hypothetical protein